MWLNLMFSWGIFSAIVGIILYVLEFIDKKLSIAWLLRIVSVINSSLNYLYSISILACFITGIILNPCAKLYDNLTADNIAIEENLTSACNSFVLEAVESGVLEEPVDTIDDLFDFIEKHPSISRDVVVLELVSTYRSNLELQDVLLQKAEGVKTLKSLLSSLCIFNFGI